MAMQVVWAPWRGVYLSGPKGNDCIFCTARDADEPRSQLVLMQSPAIVMLNKFPYANGHLMVAPQEHRADFATMPEEIATVVFAAVRRAAAVLYEVFRPDGMNIGLNLGAAAGAGFAEHVHWHLVPRWLGDTNFMPVLADVRVMPEHLEATYERLLPHFRPKP